jgi:phosphatidylethanolamine-binding protein (PEBP) family uncharacterized protein
MRVLRPIAAAALLPGLLLAGCGSSSPAAKTATVSRIIFKSPAIAGSTMPSRYTCDGANSSPPLEWGEVPPGTRELALLAIGLKPAGAKNSYSVSIEWAVAGIDPGLHRIAAGKLPSGAHLGSTTAGATNYSICPAKGVDELYQFTLYAVPPTITVPLEFAGLTLLSEIGAETAPNAAKARGSFDVSYKRKA